MRLVHEMSIMQSAIELAIERAREANARRIHEIRLRVGSLSGVVPEALTFAFEALTSGTMAENAKMVIENVPARFWCDACQREFMAEDYLTECPSCRRPSGEVRAGRELELASMEIE